MKRFTRADIRFLKAVGISTKGLRPAREARLECVQIFSPPIKSLDGTCRMLQSMGLPVDAENWMRLQFFGNPPKIGEVDGEVLAELPDFVRRVYDPDYEFEEED